MNDPWADLATPDQTAKISARRVDQKLPWHFFWAKSMDRKCLLVLRHSPGAQPGSRLPTLNGLSISESDAEDGTNRLLVFRLADSNQRELFRQLCLDIVAATRTADTEKQAVELALARTWRWHHLLRGGSSGLLSEEEQKGLIGELDIIDRFLLDNLSPADAVECWKGPLGAPKDFEIGRVCIEAKARRGAATPFVVISSEFQLDPAGTDRLFLFVIDLSGAPAGEEDAFTLTDSAKNIHSRIERADPAAASLFEARLSASGFAWDQDYTASRWIVGQSWTLEIGPNFPAISAHSIPAGISNVRYSLSLVECERFRVNSDILATAIAGRARGNPA